MAKEKLLNDLEYINYEYGRYCGLWEHCNNRKELADLYFEDMKIMANKYGIDYDKEIEKNNWEWNELINFGEEYVIDGMIFLLKNKIVEKIRFYLGD